VDAETGRGSGQVQLATRSGTNQFRGSLFWTNHNSALSANDWFQNFRGEGRNYQNRNQFGGRLGGPIVRNRTFFFFLYDAQRFVSKARVTAPVLTAQARQGLFRHFPGVQNNNAFQSNPAVDLLGNPVRPAGATGDLQSFTIFGRDPFRPGIDSSGWVQQALSKMPLPNDFTTGDGLNTAGYRWVRRSVGAETPFSQGTDLRRDQTNIRLDHHFNSRNKVFFTLSHEHVWADSQEAVWPDGYWGRTERWPRVYTSSFVSTITPALLNEFRFGLRRGSHDGYAAYDRPDIGKQVLDILPKANGVPFIPRPQIFTNYFLTYTVGSRVQTTPLYTFADTLSWTRAAHAFQGRR
jgi:hypothetical protein